MMRNWLLPLFVGILLLGCTSANDQSHIEVTNMKIRLHVAKTDQLEFTIIIANLKDEATTLKFHSSQKFDITVLTKETKDELYRFSAGKMFAQSVTTEMIPAKSEIVIKDEWDMLVNNEKIPAGEYIVTAQLLLWMVDDEEIDPESLIIAKEITIK